MSYPLNPAVPLSNGVTLTRGLHIVRVQPADKPWMHVALLDLSGVLALRDRDVARAVIIELTSPKLQARYLDTITTTWEFVSPVTDEIGAVQRWEEAQHLSDYDLILNNCEHLVNFIAYGERKSQQVSTGLKVLAGVAIAGLIVAVNKKAA